MELKGTLESFYATNYVPFCVCSFKAINLQEKLVEDINTFGIILHKIPEIL